MKRRKKTDGEKIADKWVDERGEGVAFNLDPEGLAKDIDRLIRRRQAEAWDDAITVTKRVCSYQIAREQNPYRGRRKK